MDKRVIFKSKRNRIIAVIVSVIALSLTLISVIAFAFFIFTAHTGTDYSLTPESFRFRFNDRLVDNTVSESITLDRGDSVSFRVNLSVLTSFHINESYINYNLNITNTAVPDTVTVMCERGISVYLQKGSDTVYLGSLHDLTQSDVSIASGALGCNDETEFTVVLQNDSSNNSQTDSCVLDITFTATPAVVNETYGERYYCVNQSDFEAGMVSGKIVTLASDIVLNGGSVAAADFKAIDLNGYTLTCASDYTVTMKSGYTNEKGFIEISDSQNSGDASDMSGLSVAFTGGFVPVVGKYALNVAITSEDCGLLTDTIASVLEKKLAGGGLYRGSVAVDIADYTAPYSLAILLFNYEKQDYETLDGTSFVFDGSEELISHTVTYSLTLTDPVYGTHSADFCVSYRGSSDFDIAEYYLSLIPDTVSQSVFMPSHDDYSGADIAWETDNDAFLDSFGVFNLDFSDNSSWQSRVVKVGIYISSNGRQYYKSKNVTLTVPPERRIEYVLNALRIDVGSSGPIDIDLLFINPAFKSGALTENGITGILGLKSFSVTGITTDWQSNITYSVTNGLYSDIVITALPMRHVGKIMSLEVSFLFGDDETVSRTLIIDIAGTENTADITDIETQIKNNFEGFSSTVSTNSGLHNYLKAYTNEGYFVQYSLPAMYSGYMLLKEAETVVITHEAAIAYNRLENDGSLFVKYTRDGTERYAKVSSSELCIETQNNGNTVYIIAETAGELAVSDFIRIDNELYPVTKEQGTDYAVICERTDAELIMIQASNEYPVVNTTAYIEAQVYDTRVENSCPIENIWTQDGETSAVLRVAIPITGIIKENIDIKDSLVFARLAALYDVNGDGFISYKEALNDNAAEIDLSGLDCSDITGLRYFRQLTGINLSDNNIENISELSDMTQLRVLNIGNNNLTVLSALSGLYNLTDLNISGNNISDLTVLENLIRLTTLDISGNGLVTDLSPISGLTALTSLKLDDITDLDENSIYYIYLARYRAGTGFVFSADKLTIDINNSATLTAVEIMDYVIGITEYRKTLYLPRSYKKNGITYTIIWHTDNRLINITYDQSGVMTGYTLNNAIIDTPVTLTMTLRSNGADISFARTFRMTCLQYNTSRLIYFTDPVNDKLLLSDVLPDPVLRSVIYGFAEQNNSITESENAVYISPITAVTELAGLNGVTDIQGIGQLLPALSRLDLRGSSVTRLAAVPETVRTLLLSGYDYDYTELLRYDSDNNGVNYLRKLYVNGCYNLTKTETLSKLYSVYTANDNHSLTNSQHVDIYLTEDTTAPWNPFTDYNLRYSDSILSYITMQELDEYSLFRYTTGVYAMYAEQKGGNYYYSFGYYGDAENKLSYYADGTAAVTLIKAGSGNDNGNTITENVEAVSGTNGNCESIRYKSLVASAKVAYIRVRFKSAEVVHGEHISFEKAIQLKFEFNENIHIYNTENGISYRLEEVFPGEDIRDYVLSQLSAWAVAASGREINGTYYVGNGSYTDTAVNAGYKKLVGTDGIITASKNDLVIYGQYISNSERTSTFLTGLRFLTNINTIHIYRDANLGTGAQLCNLTTLKTTYSNIDLSEINPAYVSSLKSIIAPSHNLSTSFYDNTAYVYIKNSDDSVTIGHTAPTGYNSNDYTAYRLSDFFDIDNSAGTQSLATLGKIVNAFSSGTIQYSGGATVNDIFYLNRFSSLTTLEITDCALYDYMFLLPYTNKASVLGVVRLYNHGGEKNSYNLNLNSAATQYILNGVYNTHKTDIYAGNYGEGTFISYISGNTTALKINYPDNFWEAEEVPETDPYAAVTDSSTGFVKTVDTAQNGGERADAQVYFHGDIAVLPGRHTINGITYSLQWKLNGSGNANYFNDLLSATTGYSANGITCINPETGRVSTKVDNGLGVLATATKDGTGVFENVTGTGNSVSFIMPSFPYDTYFYLTVEVLTANGSSTGKTFVYPILLIHDPKTEGSNPMSDGISSGAYIDNSDHGYSDSSSIRIFQWICQTDKGLQYSYAQTTSESGILERGGVYGSYITFTDPKLRFLMYMFFAENGANQGSASSTCVKNASMALPGAFFLTTDSELSKKIVSQNYTLQVQLLKNLSIKIPKGGSGAVEIAIDNNNTPGTGSLYSFWAGGTTMDQTGMQIKNSTTIKVKYTWNTKSLADNWSCSFTSLDGMEIFNGLTDLTITSDSVTDMSWLEKYQPLYVLGLHTGAISKDALNMEITGLKGIGTGNGRSCTGVSLTKITLKVGNESRNYTLYGSSTQNGNNGVITVTVPANPGTYYYNYSYATAATIKSVVITFNTDALAAPAVNMVIKPTGTAAIASQPAYKKFYLELPAAAYASGAFQTTASPNTGYVLVDAADIFVSGNLRFVISMKIVSITENDVTGYYSRVFGYAGSELDSNGIATNRMKFEQYNGMLYIKHDDIEENIKSFMIGSYGVTSLQGIQVFAGIKNITVIKNNLSDISCFSTLHLESFTYANSAPTQKSKFSISYWKPLIDGSSETLKSFEYTHKVTGYEPDESANIMVYVDELAYLLDFPNIESINIGYTDEKPSVYLDMPSAKYIFNKLLDKSFYPCLTSVTLYGHSLRAAGEDSLSIVIADGTKYTVTNSDYQYAQKVLSEIVPYSGAVKTDNSVDIAATGVDFYLNPTFMYLGLVYRIEWQSLSPNVTVTIEDGNGDTALIESEEALFENPGYRYHITVTETGQPITTYLIANIMINGSIYIRPYYIDVYTLG